MRAELHIFDQVHVEGPNGSRYPHENLRRIRLNDVQFGGLLTAIIQMIGGPLAGPRDEDEVRELSNLLLDIQNLPKKE